jgi:hypothetical protein
MRTPLSRKRIAFLAVALAAAVPSCADPIREDATAALGGEPSGVRPGPNHRPGQPCLVCHDEGGEASPFTIAGTVYVDPNSDKVVGGVDVIVIDSAGRVFTSKTNCAGNFYITPNQFRPRYPIWIDMRAGTVHRSMESPSYREGSCAACHWEPRGPSSAGRVYLIDDPSVETPPPNDCN